MAVDTMSARKALRKALAECMGLPEFSPSVDMALVVVDKCLAKPQFVMGVAGGHGGFTVAWHGKGIKVQWIQEDMFDVPAFGLGGADVA